MTTQNLNLGRIMFQTQGSWNTSTAYVVDDIVYANGLTFICTTNNTNQNPVLAQTDYASRINSSYWSLMSEGFNFRGTWSNNTIYYPNDIVTTGNTFGGQYGSYICRKTHTSILNYRDLWYNPGNEWDEFTRSAGSMPARNAVRATGNFGPIGWRGNPFVPSPTWGGSNSWNGNIPWNIPSYAKRWEWTSQNGIGNHNSYGKSDRTTKDGKQEIQGLGNAYISGYDNNGSYGSQQVDPGFKRDYYNNFNPTGGYRGQNWKKDTNAGEPTIVQMVTTYYGPTMFLYNNGTVVTNASNDYGAAGIGNTNETWPARYGYIQIPFPPGTFITKICHGAQGSQAQNAFCLALDSEGNLWAWGANYLGQCGVGSEPNFGKVIGQLNDLNAGSTSNYADWIGRPTKIPRNIAFNGARIVDMWTAGCVQYGTSWALDELGNMWAWGAGQYGQLGYSVASGQTRNTNYSTVPQKMGYVSGGSSGINWNTYGGIQKVMVVQRDTGSNDQVTGLFILDGQGYLWYSGYNPGYILGDNTYTTSTSAFNAYLPYRINFTSGSLNGAITNFWVMSGSANPTIWAQRSDGYVLGWGYNGNYQLGDGTTTARNYPQAASNIGAAFNAPVLHMVSVGNTTSCAMAALVAQPGVDATNRTMRILAIGQNPNGVLGTGETGGTMATSGAQGGGMFHRMWYGGSLSGQYAWQPMSLPGGINGGKIRSLNGTGVTTVGGFQILREDGLMFQTGYMGNYQISLLAAGQANLMRKPTGIY
jgi:alpha-tubulin suppressor-like RCC1 family protein